MKASLAYAALLICTWGCTSSKTALAPSASLAPTPDAEFRKSLEALGLEPITSTPSEFGERIKSELTRWTKVIKDAGIGEK